LGNASWRNDCHFCPNEALHWYAMSYWKRRGMESYDLCGAGDYKRKYGGAPFKNHFLRKSSAGWVALARTIAQKSFRLKQRLVGSLYRNRLSPRKPSDSEEGS
jgi:hypothetical protein